VKNSNTCGIICHKTQAKKEKQPEEANRLLDKIL